MLNYECNIRTLILHAKSMNVRYKDRDITCKKYECEILGL